MRWTVIVGMAAALTLAAHAVTADTIYTWTDENGVKRYSNSQPPEDAGQVNTIEGVQYDDAGGDANRQAYDRMVKEAAQEADRQFKQQEQEKAQRAEAQKQKEAKAEALRIAEERNRLLKQIEEIKNRGYSPTFTKGMQDNLIREVQEKIDKLESGAGNQ